jgi:hypothetical protein
MPLPQVGGGYQFTDGNVSEQQIFPQGAPAAKTGATVTLTAADLNAGLITFNGGTAGAVTATLPTVALLEAVISNARVDTAFDFYVVNISTVAAEDVTLATAAGWTLVGNLFVASNAATTDVSSAKYRARKTGVGTWTLYRVA